MNNEVNAQSDGHLYIVSPRGYSAYEIAVQNGFEGTEEEWLESLQGEQGEIGPQGKSAYQVAVDNGFEGTEEDFVNQYINADNYYDKDEVDKRITHVFGVVNTMKHADLKAGNIVATMGYHSISDGGGGEYIIIPTDVYLIVDNGSLFHLDNGLYAKLLRKETVNIKQFGAYGDGIHDDTEAIQNAINASNIVFVPETNSYYKVTNNITFKSGLTIYGCGEKSKLLMPNTLQKKLFDISNVKDIIIDNIKLCNESCQTGSSVDLNKNRFIFTENVENITIKNCYFDKAYSRGIEIFKTKNLKYINNVFTNATFDMLLLLPEVENVVVDNSIFDTVTSTYTHTYLFSTGHLDQNTYDFACKNITVKNSKFLNNPNWEGIDTHSCNGFYCENNYIENCKAGIMAQYGSTYPITREEIKHGDIYIKNNIIVKSPASVTYGIVVGVGGNENFLCKNVNVENNYVEGYGNGETIGAIHVIGIKGSNILNNVIIKSKGVAMALTNMIYSDVKNNKIIDINCSYGVHYIAGCWFINFKDNVIKNETFVNTISWGVRSGFMNLSQFDNNEIVATNKYSSSGTIMNGIISAGSNQIGKIGNYAKNQYGLITHYCTDTVIRPAKTETLTTVSLTGQQNTNVLTGNNALYYLCPGEEITIPGAGENGADLTTIIIEFVSKTTFKIKDTLVSSVNGVNPLTTASTWVTV